MAEFNLAKRITKTLKVNIGDESYNIPLAGSMTIAEVRKLTSDDDGLAFFSKYIPKKVLDSLTIDEVKALSEAWKEASAEDSNVDLGE